MEDNEIAVADAMSGTTSPSEPLASTRRSFTVAAGQKLSALAWGDNDPEAVLLHGRGQNAHTWDSVARELAVSLIAIDLPGHGHSDWRHDHNYGVRPNADAIAAVMEESARNALVVVGMSHGGKTTIRLAAAYPHLVRRAVIVDTTPANREGRPPLTVEQRGATGLFEAPSIFETFDEMLQATAATLPGRSIESLRTGVRRNARRLDDGRWAWRYDRDRGDSSLTPAASKALWNDLSSIRVPIMLVRGGSSGRVDQGDIDKFLRRQPEARIELVEGAGHSVQSDRPVELATLIKDFVATT